ncbi:glutathione s-transferase family protein [Salmonella enterica subsp. enterica]|nr:glutathione s-transferase family protein [Salmonella enterica subsp. enterica]
MGPENSTNVKKVLWTLEELELPYDQILAGGKFALTRMPTIWRWNPNGLVPLLKDDETDLLLWESNAIVRYLAAQYGQNRLWVDNPARRAEGENGMDWANQTLSPAHRVILMDWSEPRRKNATRRQLKPVSKSVIACLRFLMMRWPTSRGSQGITLHRRYRYCAFRL